MTKQGGMPAERTVHGVPIVKTSRRVHRGELTGAREPEHRGPRLAAPAGPSTRAEWDAALLEMAANDPEYQAVASAEAFGRLNRNRFG